ncbi:MAG: hypothetical protein U0R23_02845 [Candidatus Nanopelagicales bacterium]
MAPTALAGLVVAPAGARATDPGCSWPANPGGQVTFGVDPSQVPVGEAIGWHIEFDQVEESNFVLGVEYAIDGPDGRHTVTGNAYGAGSYTPTAPGIYTVSGTWTETCGDGVTADRTLTARPSNFEGLGPQPPYVDLFVQNGGVRLGHRRSPATALLIAQCPSLAPTDVAFTVRVSFRGKSAEGTRAHGCAAYSGLVTQHRRGKGWLLSADGKGARIFVGGGPQRSARIELLLGGAVLARYVAVFMAGRRGEQVTLSARSCPGTTCQVIRVKRKDALPAQ